MSTTYQPGPIPEKYEPNAFRTEFARIKRGAEDAALLMELRVLHESPSKVRAGMVVMADGTDWDPGSGEGVYCYYGGTWNKFSGGGGSGPAFRAWQSVSQSIPATTFTKVTYTSENFDTDAAYDASASRFQPLVAGYYFFNAAVGFASAITSNSVITLYKNGTVDTSGPQPDSSNFRLTVGGLVHLNGSTDYVEAYVYLSGSSTAENRIDSTYFSGHMVRAE